MNVKIADLMSDRVISVQPHHTVDHVRGIFEKNKISAVPVLGPDEEALGIVTTSDLVADLKGGAHVSDLMTEEVATVPQYNEVSVAARMMRKRKIHHVIVTHEQTVVGVISSFDLLKLVEDHRFTAKNPPSKSKKGNARA